MKAWIIYYRDGALYNKEYINCYYEEGAKLGIEFKLIIVEKLEFGVKDNQWFIKYENMEMDGPDFAICRAIYPLLSRQLELIGIPVFNNSFVAELCNDKAKTYQYLAKTGIKMVDSSFYQNSQVREALTILQNETVIKAVDGHGGSQVFLINERRLHDSKENIEVQECTVEEMDEIRQSILIGIGSSDVVVQPFTGSRCQDLRVYVIGKEIIAAVLRTAASGFKSNYSLGGEVRLYELSEQELDIVNNIIDEFDFGLVGIDFIIGDNGELIFNEIEDVVGARMLYQTSSINIVERYLKYIYAKLVKF